MGRKGKTLFHMMMKFRILLFGVVDIIMRLHQSACSALWLLLSVNTEFASLGPLFKMLGVFYATCMFLFHSYGFHSQVGRIYFFKIPILVLKKNL